MKILLTTDWWAPAVNGVVRSVMLLRRELQEIGTAHISTYSRRQFACGCSRGAGET